MPSFRKRSASQSSLFNTEYESSDSRVHQQINQMSIIAESPSGALAHPAAHAADFELNDSCVFKNFPKHRTSHLRFLAWVAYTRKYTDLTITEPERRTCPLLWCREIFDDQESMLQHVWNCPHLSEGLYWCSHCQKAERVGRFQCKRCQGGPSKTDRLANVAKRIFSLLGTRAAAHRGYSVERREASIALSKSFEGSEQSEIREVSNTFEERQLSDWDMTQELPNTYISEAENTSVVPEMTGCGMAAELESRAPDGPRISIWSPDHVSLNSEKTWNHPPFGNEPKSLSSSPRPETILARINTNTVYDHSIHNYQSEHTSPCSDTPLSATIISPLSATDGMNSGMQEVSPTDSEASGNSFFTDSGYTSATSQSLCNSSSSSIDQSSKLAEIRRKPVNQSLKGILEERCRDEIPSKPLSLQTISMVASCEEPAVSDARTTAHSASRCPIPMGIKMLSPFWSDASGLVESFSEVVAQHMRHSKEELKLVPPSQITKELLAMSSTTMVSIGLETLASILQGRNPTGIMHLFAFTHIAYAFAIAVDHDDTKVHTPEWFEDTLSWASELTPERHQEVYIKIAQSVWRPLRFLEMEEESQIVTAKPLATQDNRLLRASKHFLDILESFGTCKSRNSSSTGRFNFLQAAFTNKVKPQITGELITTTSIEAFVEDVADVERRLDNGLITNVRELELELICAGKLASQSDTAYTKFQDHVTMLCDPFYDSAAMSRTACHIQDIVLIKQLIPEEFYSESEDEQIQAPELNLDIQLAVEGMAWGVDSRTEELDPSVAALARDADEAFGLNSNFEIPLTPTETPLQRSFSMQEIDSSFQSSEANSPHNLLNEKMQSKYRCHCGYEPEGAEKWKASNLRRHKRTQHSVELKLYSCNHQGCTSTFTRSDNLRSHQREKGHGAEITFAQSSSRALDVENKAGETFLPRPPKRRRTTDPLDTMY